MSIRNREQLLSHGHKGLRKVAIQIAESALRAVNSYEAVKRILKLSGNELKIGRIERALSQTPHIYFLGAGKATMGQAKAFDEILGSKITKGIVIVKKGQAEKLNNIQVLEGGHPIPDEVSYKGGRKILEIVKSVVGGDLVFYCDSGGSSALMCHPAEGSGISFEDEKEMNRLLLLSGAPIYEMNAVRRHITALRGGRLQQLVLSRGAEVINFKITDSPAIVPHPPDISIPFEGGWEDQTTYQDAVKALKRYHLWEQTPASIRSHLQNGIAGIVPETPKSFKGMKACVFEIGSIPAACEAAATKAKELGYEAAVITTALEGESSEVGIVLASIAKEVQVNHRPMRPPCVLILGGETTVALEATHAERKEGGPSQEVALGFASKLAGSRNIVGLMIDSDGTDGPTKYAGGLVDSHTLERAKECGLDIFEKLTSHESSNALEKLEDAVYTGPTDTNVCDLNLIIVGEKEEVGESKV
jgi:glycerate-2-kinase